MSIEIETKHILDNLFDLKPNSKFYAYLLGNSKLGIGIMDYIIIGKELRGENGSCFEISDHEASLIDQLDDYEASCYDNQINMGTKFPLLKCAKEDFDRFKRSSLNSSSMEVLSDPHQNSSSSVAASCQPTYAKLTSTSKTSSSQEKEESNGEITQDSDSQFEGPTCSSIATTHIANRIITLPLMAEEIYHDHLESRAITPSEPTLDIRACYDFDGDLSSQYHLFEDDLQSSKIMGRSGSSYLQFDFDAKEYEKHILDTTSDFKDDYSCNSSHSDSDENISNFEDSALQIYEETTSEPAFVFDFDEEAFESHLGNATSSLKDDFSCSTFGTENSSGSSSQDSISSIEPMQSSWLDDLFASAYEELEKEMKEIRDNFFAPSHIKGRYQGECARTSPTRGQSSSFKGSGIASKEEHLLLLDIKPFFHQEKPSSSHLPFKKRFICEDVSSSNSETHSPIEPETYSRKIHQINFITPKKVSFKEDDLSRFEEDPSPRTITPSPANKSAEPEVISPYSTRLPSSSKSKKVSMIASTLVISALASNVTSHSSFRPKRRSHHAPTNVSIHLPLNRESKTSYFTSPSISTTEKGSTSKVKCASMPSFPVILTSPPIESRLKSSKSKKNKIMEEVTLKRIFSSSKKGSVTFRKILEEKGVFMPTSCNHSESSHSKSSSLPPLLNCKEDLSQCIKKEILGPTKTYDLPHHKFILGKTLGFNKTFSFSHLGTSTCGKTKVKATKYLKSPSQTKPNNISSFTCHSRSSSGTRYPTFLRLVNGEQPLYFLSVVSIFTILLLAHLLLLKLLHLPFDRGKETFTFIN